MQRRKDGNAKQNVNQYKGQNQNQYTKRNGKWAFALSAVMVVGLLAGCGKSKDTETFQYQMPTGVEEAEIYVEPIEGISDDFIRGVDISSVIAQEESGVVYYDADGNEADLFKVLAESGVNYIRVRVWNDPYNSEGFGYGGGTNDTEKAAEIGRRAAEYNMKLLVDYHYSDFWADPNKQTAPKAWAHKTYADKVTALYDFTKESLQTIIDAGADVGMVQIGNETNHGMAGETDWTRVCELMNSGSKAIREVAAAAGQEIQVAVHFTDASDFNGINGIATILKNNEVDYDVFGLSYYSYWHGTRENLENVMTNIVENYGKKVMVAETAYAYTTEDGDGHGNSIGEGDLNSNYAASVQSQATAVRDVMASVASIGEDGLGVFYWEPAWIPVNAYDYTAADAAEVLAANQLAWETYGSGWASSYASTYDREDAGQYYGGSSWDNQALFDFTGHPLASLRVFEYVKYGTTCPLAVDFVNDIKMDINVDTELVMPETVDVVYNDRSQNGPAAVTWNAEQVAAVDTSVMDEYVVEGTLEDGTTLHCTINVAYVNYVQNPSFEEKDTSMWNITYDSVMNPTDYQNKDSDAYTGTTSLHFYSEQDVYFQAEQTLTGLDNGEYYFSLCAQGGDIGTSPELYIYVITGGETYTQSFTLDGWCRWQQPEISGIPVTDGEATVGVYVKTAAKGWGTLDDFYFCLTP